MRRCLLCDVTRTELSLVSVLAALALFVVRIGIDKYYDKLKGRGK